MTMHASAGLETAKCACYMGVFLWALLLSLWALLVFVKGTTPEYCTENLHLSQGNIYGMAIRDKENVIQHNDLFPIIDYC
jgi:hypothetical protein